MFSRCLPLVALALVSVRCEAAPLSFNGVELGQKWNEFLKAHPKAEIYLSQFDDNGLTKAQEIEREGKKKEGMLVEFGSKKLTQVALYFFQNRSLTQAVTTTNLDVRGERGFISRSLLDLKPSLRKVLDELGPPTSQGVTKPEVSSRKWRHLMLVWKRPTQCAYVLVMWPLGREIVPTAVVVCLDDAPWRSTNPGFKTSWPAILPPNQDDETRRRQLIALLEELRPHSTDRIEALKPASALAVGFKMDDTAPQKSKSPSVIIKKAK
jgi:hypothetical protein